MDRARSRSKSHELDHSECTLWLKPKEATIHFQQPPILYGHRQKQNEERQDTAGTLQEAQRCGNTSGKLFLNESPQFEKSISKGLCYACFNIVSAHETYSLKQCINIEFSSEHHFLNQGFVFHVAKNVHNEILKFQQLCDPSKRHFGPP